jgi:hypothetical protein
MKKYLKDLVPLVAICLAAALLLAVFNMITEGPIAENSRRAAEQTRSSYETFAGKYFQAYFDVLEQYVKFLRTNVAEQYTEVENLNTQLGDAFK